MHGDGKVTVFSGKVELGQGNATALAQIVAEELDVPFDRVQMVMGDTARCVDQGITADSATIASGGAQLRQAAADGRQALLTLAAKRLGAPASALSVSNGVVKAKGGRRVSYAKLVGGRVLTVTIPVKRMQRGFELEGVEPKPPGSYRIVGRSIRRVDIPPKVDASYTYVQDVRVRGMLHGRVIRPPGLGAKLRGHGRPPRGARVVREHDFLGVVAEREWDAIQAAQSLDARWTKWRGLPAMDELYEFIRKTPSENEVEESAGDVETALGRAERTLRASYETPVETHGALGPSCAIVDAKRHHATVWSGTQGPNAVQQSVAQVLDLKPERVHVISYPSSGCYGRDGADPATVDAAIMSRAVGRPVRVQWMRADEHGWDPKGPATVHDLRAGLDAHGRLVAWDHEGWLPAEFDSKIIGSVLAGRAAKEPAAKGGWAGSLVYDVPAKRLRSHNQGDLAAAQNGGTGLISAWLRSPAQFQITFAKESFVDELAAAARADPIAFRLRHLSDKRMIAALKAVRRMARWHARPSPRGGGRSRHIAKGRGVAISLRGGTYNAEVAEVEVDRRTGKVRVTRIFAVQDNGLTINPRATRLGIEAGIVQSVSRTLLEQVTFDRSKVTSLDWDGYPILRFQDAPEVHVKLIDRPDVPATGSGEPSCNPVPAAVGNAVFDATGARLRRLPMRAGRVRAALD